MTELLESFGWPRDDPLDLLALQAARGMEMYLPIWLAMMQARGNAVFNVHVVGP